MESQVTDLKKSTYQPKRTPSPATNKVPRWPSRILPRLYSGGPFAAQGVRAIGGGSRVRLALSLDITDGDVDGAAKAITRAASEL